MKIFKAVIERNEDAFYAYVLDLDGCVAGGLSYSEVKESLMENIKLFSAADAALAATIQNGFNIEFEVDMESFFDLLPEINISQLAKTAGMNTGLLRQYASGTKKVSEKQAEKIMEAIRSLSIRLNSMSIIG